MGAGEEQPIKKSVYLPQRGLHLATRVAHYSTDTKHVFMPRHKKWRGIMLYPPNF